MAQSIDDGLAAAGASSGAALPVLGGGGGVLWGQILGRMDHHHRPLLLPLHAGRLDGQLGPRHAFQLIRQSMNKTGLSHTSPVIRLHQQPDTFWLARSRMSLSAGPFQHLTGMAASDTISESDGVKVLTPGSRTCISTVASHTHVLDTIIRRSPACCLCAE